MYYRMYSLKRLRINGDLIILLILFGCFDGGWLFAEGAEEGEVGFVGEEGVSEEVEFFFGFVGFGGFLFDDRGGVFRRQGVLEVFGGADG